MKKLGIVEKICADGFFVVRYDGDCAAFSSRYPVNLTQGDRVEAELEKVGEMVMHHIDLNETFEVFAHTGQSCLIACLLLIDDLQGHSAAEERSFAIFFGESAPIRLEDQSTESGLSDLSLPN